MARFSVLQCVAVFLLVGSVAICTAYRDEDFQEFDDDEAEFDFDDVQDGEDQGTYVPSVIQLNSSAVLILYML